jgi:uncharacterized protein
MLVTPSIPTAHIRLFTLALLFSTVALIRADQAPQALPFTQNWTNIGLITALHDWTAVPGIEGYRGDGLTGTTGTDPQTILAEGTSTPIDVNPNQTNPNTFSTGGVAEFHLADPTIALNGSGTADAPFILLSFATSGQSGVQVAYALRDLDGSLDNAIMPVALQYRIGNAGDFTNLPAGFVADATTGPSIATLVTPVSVTLPATADNQPLVQVRIITTNAVGNDEWVGIDDISIAAGVGADPTVTPLATPNPVTNGDPLLLTAQVTPGSPAGTSHTVVMDLSPIGGSASQPLLDDGVAPDAAAGDNVFTYQVPAVSSPLGTRTLQATVTDDLTRSSSRTFTVQVIAPVVVRLPHDIQGATDESPFAGQAVVVDGVVTGRKSNGFFIQTAPGSEDTDANTSEGLFVFTSSAPPAVAAVGSLVRVNGTVTEFKPDAGPSLTEISGPAVALLGSSPLPAPVSLSSADLSPAGDLLQWERFESMRATFAPIRAVSPTAGFLDENDAVSETSGVFYAVFADRARPFREPGIATPDPVPPCAAAPCSIPIFDNNPERLRFDSDALGAPAIDVSTGASISGVQGIVDYSFRSWAIALDPPPLGPVPTVSGGLTPVGAVPAAPTQFTVASFNMQRFYDTVNDDGTSDVALTDVAFERRLAKASAAIRVALSMPDIVGVQEMEKLSVLQTLAERVNADAQTAGQGNPGYSAILLEGNDIGGIDVGLLVRARVTVHETIQWGKDLNYTDPRTGQPALLNDRPSVSIRATVGGQPQGRLPADIIVVVNHLRSLNGVDDPVDGIRVRAKRQAQAEFLASVLQELQQAHPTTPIVSIGDYNAFEVNDGYGDIMGTVRGVPAEPSDVVNASPDLVNPDFTDAAASLPPDQQYSYSFDGNAQTLDHVLLSQSALSSFAGFIHPRINADFPEILRNTTGPERLSDHDPAVAYFSFRADGVAPRITGISASRLILWPANQALVPVQVLVQATDNSGPPVCAVESVQSSEPVTGGIIFGNTSPDWILDGGLNVRLRAERSLFGLGRLYSIKTTCADLAGNKASAYAFVLVPRIWF